MKKDVYFIIDFDSTFVTIECLDELARITLDKNPQKKKIMDEIRKINTLGMEGKIGFAESLQKRLLLFQTNSQDLKKLITLIKKSITPSVKNNKDFFIKNAENIYIVSGGFKEFIVPIIKPYGIPKNHILANTFKFNASGTVIDIDRKNPLSQNLGKITVVKNLGLQGALYIVGDGFTDYQIRENGYAEKFFAFTENIKRQEVMDKADYISASMDEILYRLNLPRAQSYPKTMIKALILGKSSLLTKQTLIDEGYRVEVIPTLPSEDILNKKINDVSILMLGENVTLSESVLFHAKKLLTIGMLRSKEGAVNLQAATQRGIAIFSTAFRVTKNFSFNEKLVCKKIIQFINTGNTVSNINLPEVNLPKLINAHRFIHIHYNKPGVLARLNNIFSQNNINIDGQYLKTNQKVGYAIIDVNKDYNPKVIKELRSIAETIRLRVLY